MFPGTNDEFICTTGETVALSVLCDGTADCSNGNDETSPICESESIAHCVCTKPAVFAMLHSTCSKEFCKGFPHIAVYTHIAD